MSQSVTLEETAALLQKADHILLLTHQYPDGDTIGSGYALCQALQSLGKTAASSTALEATALREKEKPLLFFAAI